MFMAKSNINQRLIQDYLSCLYRIQLIRIQNVQTVLRSRAENYIHQIVLRIRQIPHIILVHLHVKYIIYPLARVLLLLYHQLPTHNTKRSHIHRRQVVKTRDVRIKQLPRTNLVLANLVIIIVAAPKFVVAV